MKFPIDFNDSYPLTLGVADDYFTLSTRLKRLSRAPMQPRRRAAWLLSGALLLSFAAIVPLRLTARAQTEAKIAQLSGTVKDASGNAVADATVYLALKNRAEPLETTTSGADGRYEFTSEIGENRSVLVWADAGARGLGQSYVSQDKSGVRLADLVVAPSAPVKLLLLAPDGTRAANLRVRVGQMGPEIDEQWIVPHELAQRLQTQTNARGEAVFAALPVGQIAQFWLNDQKYYQTPIGFGDLRGGQYAPFSADESVKIGQQKDWKTIRLLAPVTLRGNVSSRVSTPIGIGKSGALVTAIRFSVWKAEEFSVPMTPQARTDAQGDYVMAGLRPGSYRVQVESEPWLARSSVSPVETRELKAPSERVDLALSGGGLIRGVMRVKGTNAPAVGQNVGVIDAKRNYQVTKTDARGAFEFRANVGTALVLTPNGSGDGQLFARFVSGQFSFENFEMKIYGDTPGGLGVLSEIKGEKLIIAPIAPRNDRSAKYDFTISGSQLAQVPVKAGATRQITLEMPAENLVKAATLSGQISRPNGKGARATIMVRPAADIDYKRAIEKPTDARGRYSIAGLKPGRYKISAQLDGEISANWVAPKLTQTLGAGANRADIKLTSGAVITGVVWAKSNHHVIPNVEVLTADKDGDGTIEKTKSNGIVRFRVAPGRVAVRLHQSSTPPPGYALTQQEFSFDAKENDKMQVVFELPQTSFMPTRAATATGTIAGTVRDERGKPLAGIKVWAYAPEIRQFNGPTTVTTKADGKYRFEEFPAGGKFAIIALSGNGYSALPAPNDNAWGLDFRALAAGQTRVIDVAMRAAPATLAGQVLQPDGSLATGYYVSPRNMKRTSTTTKANGKFWLAGVWSGPRDVYVYDAMSRKRWGPYRAAGNQRDLVLRLSERMRDKSYVLGGNKE